MEFKIGTLKDIEYFINNGYEPIGDLKFVLNNYKHLLFSEVTICINADRKIIDIQEVFKEKPYPCLINYMNWRFLMENLEVIIWRYLEVL